MVHDLYRRVLSIKTEIYGELATAKNLVFLWQLSVHESVV